MFPALSKAMPFACANGAFSAGTPPTRTTQVVPATVVIDLRRPHSSNATSAHPTALARLIPCHLTAIVTGGLVCPAPLSTTPPSPPPAAPPLLIPCHLPAIVTGGLVCPATLSTTGTGSPVVIPAGTTAFIWYNPAYPGVSPLNATCADFPPIVTVT